MNLKNIILLGLSISPLLFPVMAMSSCSKEKITDNTDNGEDVILKLSVDNISVDADGGQEIVQLTANTYWGIVPQSPYISKWEWGSISPESGNAGTHTLSIDIQTNYCDDREIMFDVVAADKRVPLTVFQKGWIIEFEDNNFKDYCLSKFDSNGDGKITKSETVDIASIYTNQMPITSLRGIEEFENLSRLAYYNNPSNGGLTELDLSKNTKLTYLSCIGHQLASLDVSHNTALTEFWCCENQLTSLDVSNNTALTYLYCNENQLTSLDLSNNTELVHVWCDDNNINSLDLSNNTALSSLDCSNNQLTFIDLSNNTALTGLTCNSNQFTSLDVSNNTALESLDCYDNPLKTLVISESQEYARWMWPIKEEYPDIEIIVK